MEKNLLIFKKILILTLMIISIFVFFKLIIFYIPFIIAYIISYILNPLINKISKKFKITRKISSIIILTAFFLISIILLSFVTTKIIEEFSFFSSGISTYIEKTISFIDSLEKNKFISNTVFIPKTTQNLIRRNINDLLNSFENNIKDFILKFISKLKDLPVFFINFIITILSIYFLLGDKFSILDKLEFQFSKKIISKIRVKLEKISNLLFGYLKAELLLICISFILVLIGLYIFKLIGMDVKYPFLMAAIIGIVDALPILGSGTVMIPWSIILFIKKDTSLGFSILGLFLLILCIKQMLEPKLVSNKIGVHPFFTLIAMYTGFKVFGFIGIITGPIILIILKEVFESFLDQGLVNYLKDEED